MAKKFGKFLMTTAALGALAAGAYYYLQKKEALDNEIFDDDDDFDDFDDDLDDEDDTERKYVDLDLSKAADTVSEKADEFKEGIDAAKAEASEKIVGAVEDAAKTTEAKVEEFFDDDDDNDGSLDAM